MSTTRRRILEAIVHLHEEVGPAATTITAIAERARVQRLTVYRHFPDDRAMVTACSAHWQSDHPLPDPAAWSGLEDPSRRFETALGMIYAYFRDGASMLARVLADEEGMPEVADVMAPWWTYMREVAGGLSAGWGIEGSAQRLLRAAVGHAMAFDTWRSLSDEGLSDAEAAELMTRLVREVATGSKQARGPDPDRE